MANPRAWCALCTWYAETTENDRTADAVEAIRKATVDFGPHGTDSTLKDSFYKSIFEEIPTDHPNSITLFVRGWGNLNYGPFQVQVCVPCTAAKFAAAIASVGASALSGCMATTKATASASTGAAFLTLPVAGSALTALLWGPILELGHVILPDALFTDLRGMQATIIQWLSSLFEQIFVQGTLSLPEGNTAVVEWLNAGPPFHKREATAPQAPTTTKIARKG